MDENNNLKKVIDTHGDNLYRICLIMLGNKQDAEDVLQETFLKYMQKAPKFRDDTHEKASLSRCVSNMCKDMLRFRKRHRYENIDDLEVPYIMEEDRLILEEIMTLSTKYKEF